SRSGSHKRWQPDRLREAATAIRARTGGTLLVGWGPAEREEALALAAEIPGALPIPPATIPELAILLQRADLYVGMDTGPMHVAALLGTPTVGVFGRSDPVIHGPAAHLPGRAVAGPEAREWKTRSRRGLPPFVDPEPAAVVEAAMGLLAGARSTGTPSRESPSPTADR
ncbi:MAG TPA: glycosyltransferase family 9 protein, partial [Gemmatimonadota bacterium]|nr:glycosyltransferase family 9 protein [Gemmatimonadota bacterium]